jgi:hypothetical protein
LNSRTTIVGRPRSRQYAWARISSTAFAVEYDQRDLKGEPSTRSASSATGPFAFFP